MFEPRTPGERATEEVVRRYIGRMVLRYLPFTVAVVVFFVMVLVVPTRSPGNSLASGGSQGNTLAKTESGPASGAAAGPADTGGAGAAPPAAGTAGSGAAGTGGSRRGTTGGSVAVSADVGGAGQTVSGVQCGPGVRQVSWSKYSALCVPAFHGNNGGATAYGVSPTTITVTYRISD